MKETGDRPLSPLKSHFITVKVIEWDFFNDTFLMQMGFIMFLRYMDKRK